MLHTLIIHAIQHSFTSKYLRNFVSLSKKSLARKCFMTRRWFWAFCRQILFWGLKY